VVRRALIAVGLAFVVAGCGGTTDNLGSGASDLVPSNAAVFIAIDTNPQSDQWQTLQRLADKFPDKQKAVAQLKRELRKDPGVSWEKDVKPWLGEELDVVWLDFEADGENVVVLTQPKDAAKFEQFVEKANKSEKNPDDRVVYEQFRGWYVLSPKQTAIDRFKRESESAAKTLSQESQFKSAMDRLGGDSIVRSYVSGKAVMEAARKYGGKETRPYLDKVGTLDWIAIRSGVQSNGVALDAIAHGTPGELFKGLKFGSDFKAELPDTVPRNALIYWTFHGTKGMFKQLEHNALFKKTPELRQFRDVFADLDKLLQGENAFYVRPGKRIPEITFVASPGEDEDGALIVDRLLDREFQFAPEHEMIAGVNTRKFASEGVGIYWGNVNGRLVLTDMPAGIRSFKKPGKSLSDKDSYKDAADASGLPDKTAGFVFVDIKSSIPWGERLSEERIPADIKRNLKPLHSAVEYVASHTHEVQVTFFLLIK
jgi:Protein of unknown function (DUF3352)